VDRHKKNTQRVQANSARRSWFNGKNNEKGLTWCFRMVSVSPSILYKLPIKEPHWTRFEQENEQLLTSQYYSFTSKDTKDSIDIHDGHIFDGTVTVRVIFQEAIAFAVDPERLEPIIFEIVFYPKLNWIQKWTSTLVARRRRKQGKKVVRYIR
jgi:hypothetical protein